MTGFDLGAEQARLKAAALKAAERGWHVFPLRAGDKRPAIRDWQARATIDPGKIVRCWRLGAFNVGIACGPSELVVVDLDVPKGDDSALEGGRAAFAHLAAEAGTPAWTDTFTVTTASGGAHLYFKAPDDVSLRNTAGRLAPLVDTRADGGYVVGPGSVVRGRPYIAIGGRPVAELPPTLKERLTRAPKIDAPEPVLLSGSVDRYAEAALRGEVQRIESAAPGRRNHTLNSAAYSIGQLIGAGLMPSEVATPALDRAARGAGLSEREIEATVRSGLSAGVRHPRQLVQTPQTRRTGLRH